MPVVKIDMWKGHSMEEKEKLIEKVTDAVVDSIECKSRDVFVILNEVPKEHWGIEGQPSSKKFPK